MRYCGRKLKYFIYPAIRATATGWMDGWMDGWIIDIGITTLPNRCTLHNHILYYYYKVVYRYWRLAYSFTGRVHEKNKYIFINVRNEEGVDR